MAQTSHPAQSGTSVNAALTARQNRVTPTGDIIATPLRGAWTGNRGILHRGEQIVRSHAGTLWITCALTYKDWTLKQWQDGHFTVLFFHDEAVSLAAGHRPCALCRRGAYNAFRTAWVAGNGEPAPSARQLDRQLHADRNIRGTHRRRTHRNHWSALPAGAFGYLDGHPALVLHDSVVPWTPAGYGTPRPRPRGVVVAITPRFTLAALRAGYHPQLAVGDPDAR